ncbi:DUF4168 domain-containing protein [Desulfobotulus sp. H1]|uniref:DUF4168 domain-containing protein n=1 Tax=Desulfobotulus pelophilus TaxID=2823377 RepID=A0ABT3N7S3_9BACT|nr:DUF4168 domain-containing protein [Desulfobotulus pelophilus]MCW7753211.1 DUF4168 domain-containing protein [Desulfobotulus pelophilus]
MFSRWSVLCITPVLLILTVMGLPVMAQNAYQQPAMQNQGMEVSGGDLKKAAEAYVEIVQINQGFQEALQGVETAGERQSLQMEANEKMLSAVKEAGLDAQSYNAIVQQVGADEELRMKFTSMLKQLH